MTDFRDILKDLNVDYSEDDKHSTAGWVQFECPFCGKGSSKRHMGYNLSTRSVNCWRCGWHSLTETLTLLGVPYKESKALRSGLGVDRNWTKPERKNLKLPKAGPLLYAHKKYLRSRGFKPSKIERIWGVQGIGLHSRLAWRLFIPIHLREEIVSWTTRAIGNNGLRYISASAEEESINHKELLYGEQYAQHSIIIHEGPLDVWATGRGSVGTLGVSYTRSQVLRMVKYPFRAVCFDNSAAAQKRAQELCSLLAPFDGTTCNVCLESGEDPASADKGEIKQLRKTFLK